jgi:hypothetical protein
MKMKKKKGFQYAVSCSTLLFLMVPDICVGEEGIRVLNHISKL